MLAKESTLIRWSRLSIAERQAWTARLCDVEKGVAEPGIDQNRNGFQCIFHVLERNFPKIQHHLHAYLGASFLPDSSRLRAVVGCSGAT